MYSKSQETAHFAETQVRNILILHLSFGWNSDSEHYLLHYQDLSEEKITKFLQMKTLEDIKEYLKHRRGEER